MINEDSELIRALKKVMDFNLKLNCVDCVYCSRHEKDANSPYTYTCGFAGNVEFEVQEDDFCSKLEVRV